MPESEKPESENKSIYSDSDTKLCNRCTEPEYQAEIDKARTGGVYTNLDGNPVVIDDLELEQRRL